MPPQKLILRTWNTIWIIFLHPELSQAGAVGDGHLLPGSQFCICLLGVSAHTETGQPGGFTNHTTPNLNIFQRYPKDIPKVFCYLSAEMRWSSQKPKYQYRDQQRATNLRCRWWWQCGSWCRWRSPSTTSASSSSPPARSPSSSLSFTCSFAQSSFGKTIDIKNIVWGVDSIIERRHSHH